MDTEKEITSTQPLVSILMLTYNRSTFIREAISSIQKQTYTNWKLIIIDDGSTDNTHNVISSLNEGRINYIQHENNGGMITRRKESLGYTEGIYTAVLDSDDVWTSPNKLAEQVSYMENNSNCSAVGTFINLIDKNSVKFGENKYKTDDTNIRKRFFFRNQFTHSSILMRNSHLSRTKGYRDTTLAEDYDLFLQLGQYGTLANIPKFYTAYRIHSDSFNHKRLLMAQSVLRIVQSHKGRYPNYHIALIKCYTRIALTWLTQEIQNFFKK